MTTVTILAGQTSVPLKCTPGAIVTMAPGSGATARIEYTTGSNADISNGVAIWAAWPLGPSTVSQTDTVLLPIWVRIAATGGSATLTTDQGEIQNEFPENPWESGAYNFGDIPVPPPTGNAIKDTANINAAIRRLPSQGGALLFQAGTYITTGGHTISVPVRMIGAGSGSTVGITGGNATATNAITWIKCTSTNVAAFSINADYCAFNAFFLQQTGGTAGTSSVGIKCTGGGSRWRYFDIGVSDFYINVDHAYGNYWSMQWCVLQNPWDCDLRIQDLYNGDEGDVDISYNWFLAGSQLQIPTSATTAYPAVRYASGGGLRFVGNKINVGPDNTAGHIAVFSDGIYITAFTSTELTFSDNSFGACTDSAIKVDFSGVPAGTTLSKIIITNNNALRIAQPGSAALGYAPATAADKFFLNVVNGITGGRIQQLLISDNTITGTMSVAHLESVRQAIVGNNSVAAGAYGTPLVEVGPFTENIARVGRVSTTEVAPSNFGVNLFGSGTSQYRTGNQISLVDNGSASTSTNMSVDEFVCRMANPSVGLYSGNISAAAINATDTDVLKVTVTGHSFAVGDLVYIAGVTSTGNIATNLNNATAGNIILHQVCAADTNTISVTSVGQAAWTGAYTALGYAAHAGPMFEVIAGAGAAYTIELDINGSVSGGPPVSVKMTRQVWVQQNTGGQALMAVMQTYGTDAAMVDPTANVGVGTAPKIANTQDAVGGAVATANSAVNNPVFSVSASGAGKGIEVAFQSSKISSLSGNYAAVQGAQAGTDPNPSFTVTSLARVGGAGTTIYRITVPGAIATAMAPCVQFTIAGATGGFTGLNATWYCCNVNNNQSFDFDAGSDLGTPATGTITYTRDRFMVSRAGLSNNANILHQAYVGQSIASITVTGQTVSSVTVSGTTATVVTAAAHSLSSGANMTMSGATGALATQVNITAFCTPVNSTTFTYPVAAGAEGVAAGSPAYTIATGTRRIAQLLGNNNFLVDRPYRVDVASTAMTSTPNAVNKLVCYVRPVNDTGIFIGTVNVKIKGWYRFINKLAT